jgi:hypothetical protein
VKIFLLLALLFFATSARAQVQEPSADKATDVLYLKNGSVIKGDLIEAIPDGDVKLRLSDGQIFTFPFQEVSRFEKSFEKPKAEVALKDVETKPKPEQYLEIRAGAVSEFERYSNETDLGLTLLTDLFLPSNVNFFKYMITAGVVFTSEKSTGVPFGRLRDDRFRFIGLGGIQAESKLSDSESLFATTQLGGGLIQGRGGNSFEPVFSFGAGIKIEPITITPTVIVTRQLNFFGGKDWMGFAFVTLGFNLDTE